MIMETKLTLILRIRVDIPNKEGLENLTSTRHFEGKTDRGKY